MCEVRKMKKKQTLQEIIKEVERTMPEIVEAELKAIDHKDNMVLEIHDKVFSLATMRMYAHTIIDKLNGNKPKHKKTK
jgi:hypothetical protein